MKATRPPRRGGTVDVGLLEKLNRQAMLRVQSLWDRAPRRTADYLDPYLDPAQLGPVIRRAQAGERTARLMLRSAIIAHADAGQPLERRLTAYVAEALRTDPAKAFGFTKKRGRDAHTESVRKGLSAAILAFLREEADNEQGAQRRAAKVLGYASTKSLLQACGPALERLLRRLESDPHREWHLAWGAYKACQILLGLQQS